MSIATSHSLADLYLEDEVAWLDMMADLVRRRDVDGLDWANLAELLADMGISERRQVKSRLVILLAHMLKWDHQNAKRSPSWRTTVLIQSQELADRAGSGVLRAHVEAVLGEAYGRAVQVARSETNLPEKEFPPACPYTIGQLLAIDPDNFVIP